jgi:hypothetical protein
LDDFGKSKADCLAKAKLFTLSEQIEHFHSSKAPWSECSPNLTNATQTVPLNPAQS